MCLSLCPHKFYHYRLITYFLYFLYLNIFRIFCVVVKHIIKCSALISVSLSCVNYLNINKSNFIFSSEATFKIFSLFPVSLVTLLIFTLLC